jgi:hypothetical protein
LDVFGYVWILIEKIPVPVPVVLLTPLPISIFLHTNSVPGAGQSFTRLI